MIPAVSLEKNISKNKTNQTIKNKSKNRNKNEKRKTKKVSYDINSPTRIGMPRGAWTESASAC
jgi:hypothetical protein